MLGQATSITVATPALKVVLTDELRPRGHFKKQSVQPSCALVSCDVCLMMPCQDTPSRSSSRSIAIGRRPKRLRGLSDSVDVPSIPGTTSPLPASDGLGLSFVVRPTGHVSRPSLLGPLPSRWSSTGYSPSYRPPSSGLLGVPPVLPAPPVPYRPPCGVEHPHPEPALQLRRPLFPPAYPDACPPVSASLPTPAGIRPPLPVHVAGIRVEPSAQPACMSEVVSRTMTTLSRQWLAFVEALGNSSTLLSEASESHQPQQHLLRVIQKFAPSTLTRYFTEWQLWVDFARSQNDVPALLARCLVTLLCLACWVFWSASGLSINRATLRPRSVCMGPILVKLHSCHGVAS